MNTELAGPLGSDSNAVLGPLVVNGVKFEPLRIPVPQIARGLPKEVHVFSREMMLVAVAAERERLIRMVEARAAPANTSGTAKGGRARTAALGARRARGAAALR